MQGIVGEHNQNKLVSLELDFILNETFVKLWHKILEAANVADLIRLWLQ